VEVAYYKGQFRCGLKTYRNIAGGGSSHGHMHHACTNKW